MYGTPVTAGAIGLTVPVDKAVDFDATDMVRWEAMGRVLATFGGPVMERFVRERKIEVTPEEIKQWQDVNRKRNTERLRVAEVQLAELKARRKGAVEGDADLLDRKIQNEVDQLKNLRRLQDDLARPGAEEAGKWIIRGWKIERELFRLHGGQVIHQQLGPEALDARRKLFEEAEKRGDISFTDDGVRHLFYHYYRMKHLVMKPEEARRAFEKPWFFEGGSGK